jgi:LuxR family maltose regulon positive regulatory protein
MGGGFMSPTLTEPRMSRHHPSPGFTRVIVAPAGRRPGQLVALRRDGEGDVEALSGPVLLATKLHAPRVRPGLVVRARLLEQLLGSQARLTVVGAGAGWGKTTLLAQWRASDHARFAWLSLEPADNDPVRFWAYVVAALRTVSPRLGETGLVLLRTPGVSIEESVLPLLLNELATLDDSLVLVLDDYHLIDSGAVHAQLALFLERLPATVRLVVASRSDPPLPLARLRACGELLEVRADELRFDGLESSMLLNDLLDLELAPADVEGLQARTEGWAAGLYLAALSLRDREDRSSFVAAFAGDDRHLVDYLGDEVLAGLSPDRRRFLLHTSVLSRLSGELCDAVTGQPGGAEMLAGLEGSNLFVVPLDRTRSWYRYHHLFAELLRQELEHSEPELVSELHRRASLWYHGRGEIDDAITHAIAATEIAAACDLIATHWNAFANEGKLVTVAAWLDALPAGSVKADARLCLARAWHALLSNRNDQVEQWIATAETAPIPGPIRDGTSSIEGGAALIRTIHLYYLGDMAGCERWAKRALELEQEHPLWHSMAYSGIAAAHYWRGEEQAATAFERTASLAQASGNVLSAIWALEFRALLAAQQDDPDNAARLVAQARALAAEHSLEAHWVHAVGHIALCYASEARGDLGTARDEAETALELVRRGPGRLETALTLITIARLLPERAAESLAEARRTIADCPDPGYLRTHNAPAPRPRGATRGDDLSKRERDVLRLLPTKLTLREIGGQLYVSENTVKTHAHSIYRKLNASSRAEAIAGARELDLL